MDYLRAEVNYRQLRLFSRDGFPGFDKNSVEDLQKRFDLFEKITKDRYKIGSLVVFGPILTIMSLFTQKICNCSPPQNLSPPNHPLLRPGFEGRHIL